MNLMALLTILKLFNVRCLVTFQQCKRMVISKYGINFVTLRHYKSTSWLSDGLNRRVRRFVALYWLQFTLTPYPTSFMWSVAPTASFSVLSSAAVLPFFFLHFLSPNVAALKVTDMTIHCCSAVVDRLRLTERCHRPHSRFRLTRGLANIQRENNIGDSGIQLEVLLREFPVFCH